jgi:hypothetical protein
MGFENGSLSGFSSTADQPAALSISSDFAVDGTHSLLATVNAKGTGTATVQANAPASFSGGQTVTIFVNVPSGTNWGYIQAYVQEPGHNYRWTASGWKRPELIPGEWNSVVIHLPSDYASAGAQLGISLSTTGTGTIKAYVDAISSEN